MIHGAHLCRVCFVGSLLAVMSAYTPLQAAITFTDSGQRLVANGSSNSADVALGDLDGDGSLDAASRRDHAASPYPLNTSLFPEQYFRVQRTNQ